MLRGNHQEGIKSNLERLLVTKNDYDRYRLIFNELKPLCKGSAGIQLLVQNIGRVRQRSSSPYNISLKIPGNNPDDGRIIFRAHYDTTRVPLKLMLSRRFLRRAPPEPPSADDNLSSVAVLMELTEDYVNDALKGNLPERETYIEFVTGEEGGKFFQQTLRFFVPLILAAPGLEIARFLFSENVSPVVYEPWAIAASYFAMTSTLVRLPLTQLGLVGSIARNNQLGLTIDDIVLTPDMVGAGKDFCIPKSSFGVAPITWGILPVRYDLRIVDTLRELFLLEDNRANKPQNPTPLTYIAFGSSDMATPDMGVIQTIKNTTKNWKYGRRAAGVFSISPDSIWRLHSEKDTKKYINPENLDVVYRVLRRAPTALTQKWKKESDIIDEFKYERAQIYSLDSTNEQIIHLLGRFRGAQISVVYKAEQTQEGYQSKEFLTWGIGRLEEILERESIKSSVSVVHQKEPFTLELADRRYYSRSASRLGQYIKPFTRCTASLSRAAAERLALPATLGLVGAEATLAVIGMRYLWHGIETLNTHPLVGAGLYLISGLAGLGAYGLGAITTLWSVMAASPYIGKSLQYLEDLRDRTGMMYLVKEQGEE